MRFFEFSWSEAPVADQKYAITRFIRLSASNMFDAMDKFKKLYEGCREMDLVESIIEIL